MKIYKEESLSNFEFWSGAKDRVERLTNEDFDIIESELEIQYPEGMDETEINDMFWFEFDTIAQMLGYEDEEDFDRKRDPNYVDDDELAEYAEDWMIGFIEDEATRSEIMSELIELFNLYDEYTESCIVPDEDCENGPQMADFLVRNLENGYVSAMSCIFDEFDSGHDAYKLIPTTESLRRMAMEEKAKQNENI